MRLGDFFIYIGVSLITFFLLIGYIYPPTQEEYTNLFKIGSGRYESIRLHPVETIVAVYVDGYANVEIVLLTPSRGLEILYSDNIVNGSVRFEIEPSESAYLVIKLRGGHNSQVRIDVVPNQGVSDSILMTYLGGAAITTGLYIFLSRLEDRDRMLKKLLEELGE